MNENMYHYHGLIAELLSVANFQVGHMAQVHQALQFLLASRQEYEASQPKAEEVTQTGADSIDAGSQDSGNVRKPKKRKPR